MRQVGMLCLRTKNVTCGYDSDFREFRSKPPISTLSLGFEHVSAQLSNFVNSMMPYDQKKKRKKEKKTFVYSLNVCYFYLYLAINV